MIYAGIGSRQTPQDILDLMATMAYHFSSEGHVLRSGHAPGADQAFEYGARLGTGKMEIYLPWRSFEGGCDYAALNEPSERAMEIAAEYHPGWPYLKQGAKKLHARNTHQALGADCSTPADMIVCWSPGKGGTEQALRLAKAHDIPVANLHDPEKLAIYQGIFDHDQQIPFEGLDKLD